MPQNISISSSSQFLSDINNILTTHVDSRSPRLSSVAMGIATGMVSSYYAAGQFSDAPAILKPIVVAAVAIPNSFLAAGVVGLTDSITDRLISLTQSLETDIQSGKITKQS